MRIFELDHFNKIINQLIKLIVNFYPHLYFKET